jgi:hypothetical protein
MSIVDQYSDSEVRHGNGGIWTSTMFDEVGRFYAYTFAVLQLARPFKLRNPLRQ